MNGEDVDCFAGPAGMVKTRMVDASMVGGSLDGHVMRVWENINRLMVDDQEYERREDGSFVFEKRTEGVAENV